MQPKVDEAAARMAFMRHTGIQDPAQMPCPCRGRGHEACEVVILYGNVPKGLWFAAAFGGSDDLSLIGYETEHEIDAMWRSAPESLTLIRQALKAAWAARGPSGGAATQPGGSA